MSGQEIGEFPQARRWRDELTGHPPAGVGLRHQDHQELLGHRSVNTTMVYAHVLNSGGYGVRSPITALERLLRILRMRELCEAVPVVTHKGVG